MSRPPRRKGDQRMPTSAARGLANGGDTTIKQDDGGEGGRGRRPPSTRINRGSGKRTHAGDNGCDGAATDPAGREGGGEHPRGPRSRHVWHRGADDGAGQRPVRPRRGREAPGGTKRTKRGRSDEGRSGRTTRTAREAIRIIGPLANDEDDGEKPTAEQGDGLGGRQHAGSTRSIGRHDLCCTRWYILPVQSRC